MDPVPCRGRDGAYARCRQHAISRQRGSEWVEWSEDEPCSQRGQQEGAEKAPSNATDFCTIAPDVLGTGGGGGGCTDQFDGNDSSSSAAQIGSASFAGLEVCAASEDWFRISVNGPVTATVRFSHADGDLDVTLYDAALNQIDSSTSTSDTETVKGDGAQGDLYLKIFGYRGIANRYALEVAAG